MEQAKSIGIIGGGSIAISFLYQFTEQLIQNNLKANIFIFEPQQNIGSGYPYQASGAPTR